MEEKKKEIPIETHINIIKKSVNMDFEFEWKGELFNLKRTLNYLDKIKYLKLKNPSYYYETIQGLLWDMSNKLISDRKELREHFNILFNTYPFKKQKENTQGNVSNWDKQIGELTSNVVSTSINNLKEMIKTPNDEQDDKIQGIINIQGRQQKLLSKIANKLKLQDNGKVIEENTEKKDTTKDIKEIKESKHL